MNSNPPAFPVKVKRNTSSDPLATPREVQLEGMTLHDYVAASALPAIITATVNILDFSNAKDEE